MKLMTGSLLFVVALLFFPWNSMRGGEQQDQIMKELSRLEQEFGGHLGLMARNLATGEEVRYNAGERFPTASTIKLPVMAAFFHLADAGKVDMHQRVTLTDADKKPGSGLLQMLDGGMGITLLDAVRLMITVSDNTATNLVLDHLASSHQERMRVVNDFLKEKGLKNTRLLNRLYSWETKLQTPEAVRYGIGVSTPEDMVILLDGLHRRTLAEPASCATMIDILKSQTYNDMIPRYLPFIEERSLEVAHKTGGINETKVDVGLVLSKRVNLALAIFVDKHPDHREMTDNHASMLAARAARAVWNHFTGMTGYDPAAVEPSDVDWTQFPGGTWGIFRSSSAPFPHPQRRNGFTRPDSTVYPYWPHYCDSSIVVFVPTGFHETGDGANVIVHFHGHMNDNLSALEKYMMPQAMVAQKTNAILVIPQGPYRARDSFGGKMEDEKGLSRMVEDVLSVMKKENIVRTTAVNKMIVSAHSGGYRPAAFCVDRGGMNDHITHLFLFDAFYGQHDYFRAWLNNSRGTIMAAYTDHLEREHLDFSQSLNEAVRSRFLVTKTTEEHDNVVQTFMGKWLASLPKEWRLE